MKRICNTAFDFTKFTPFLSKNAKNFLKASYPFHSSIGTKQLHFPKIMQPIKGIDSPPNKNFQPLQLDLRPFFNKKKTEKTERIQSITETIGSSAYALVLPAILLLGILSLSDEVKAEKAPNNDAIRLKALLDMDPEKRTTDQTIELFNYLLEEGEKEAKKAVGKDIILVFGDTGAGKSTLINFLNGCKMQKREDGKIEVAPDSPIKEIAEIGHGTTSCTYLPEKYSIKVQLDNGQVVEHVIFDTPGITDNRGPEVALAAAITANKIINNAKSVKFVLVIEYGMLSTKAKGWKETVTSLKERFDYTVGSSEKSLCVIFNNAPISAKYIKNELNEHTPNYPAIRDVTTYDPLNADDRDRLFGAISAITPFRELAPKVVLDRDSFGRMITLANTISKEVSQHVIRGERSDIARAGKRAKFTHGIIEYGNEELALPHKLVVGGIEKRAQELERIMHDEKLLKNEMAPFRKYKILRDGLSTYWDFTELDAKVLTKIDTFRDQDPRASILTTLGVTGGISGVVNVLGLPVLKAVGGKIVTSSVAPVVFKTVATAIVNSPAVPVIVTVAAVTIVVVGAGRVGYIYYNRYWNPSKEEKELQEFFDFLKS